MMQFYYEYENGAYNLYADYGNNDKRLVTVTDKIAMAYDPETYTLLKHGRPDAIQRWAEASRKYGFLDFNVITFSKEFPLEEINKVLSTTGYLKFILNESADKHLISR